MKFLVVLIQKSNYSNNGPIACLLEVDLGYPVHLHDLNTDYPLVDVENKSNPSIN